MTGLPRDELFLYEDALRQGHTVVIALVEDDALAEAARAPLAAGGAETIDAARERWWLGLRSAEQEQYADSARAFERDEVLYRRGFEAALGADARGRAWDESIDRLRARYAGDCDAPAFFRQGWERGQTYQRDVGAGPSLKKTA